MIIPDNQSLVVLLIISLPPSFSEKDFVSNCTDTIEDFRYDLFTLRLQIYKAAINKAKLIFFSPVPKNSMASHLF